MLASSSVSAEAVAAMGEIAADTCFVGDKVVALLGTSTPSLCLTRSHGGNDLILDDRGLGPQATASSSRH